MAIFGYSFSKTTPQNSITMPTGESILETVNLRSIELPKVVETRANDWVLLGQNNQFPLDLLEYKQHSAIHSAIIDSKSKLISGNGFIFADTREASNAWLIENFRSIPFWRKLDEVFYLVARDQQTFGYSCFEVRYNADRNKIVDINWVDASRIACGKKEDGEEIDDYYYSNNWANIRNNPPKKIESFDGHGEEFRQLVFIKYPENNMNYYALPTYYSALKWIKADGQMAEYNLAALNNGFSPSIVFKFYKKPTPQERQMNSEAIKAQHGGPKNAGKAIILYSDGKDLAPDVDTLDATNIDQRLLQLSDQITQQIISAHKAHPGLLGIQVPGKLGYSNELLQSWSIFDKMVITPERKLLLDHFNAVFLFNGITNARIEPLIPIDLNA